MPRDFEPRHGGLGDSVGDGWETGGRDARARRRGGRSRPGLRGGRGGRSGPWSGRGSGPVPGPRPVPELTPVRPGLRSRHRMPRVLRGRRRLTAAGLAVAALALAAQIARGDDDGPSGAGPGREPPVGPTAAAQRAHGRSGAGHGPVSEVSAPVRIADAAAVRLLHPGDRVDVIAGAHGTEQARVVARCARVDRMPRSRETDPVGPGQEGALVVLRVPREKATALAGAGAAGRLAVTLC